MYPPEPPRSGRIKAHAPANVDCSNRLSLTLIGRVTNRTAQKVWALIPFFTELWKAEGRPVGSDLGKGMFQFQFETEADLLAVLDRRPFHYAKWMIILQRWEPTVSASFPSLIPFWIKVQGIPIHLWSEETVKSLGEDIGIFEKTEITDFAVKMRVQVNGLLPLIKTSVIEYSNGDEVTASFVYEKLERHCSKCFRLDHEVKDCLIAKHQARERNLHDQSTKDSVMDNGRKEESPDRAEAFRFTASRADGRERRSHHSNLLGSQKGETMRAIDVRRNQRSERAYCSRRDYKEPPRDWRNRHDQSKNSRHEASYRDTLVRNDARHRPSSQNRNSQLNVSRQKTHVSRDEQSSSRSAQDQSKRGNPRGSYLTPPPRKTFDEALSEVREACSQYTQCADPTKRAVRSEWMRKAEEEGHFEKSAAEIILAREEEVQQLIPVPHPTNRIPAMQRIEPQSTSHNAQDKLPAYQRLDLQETTSERTSALHNSQYSQERPPASQRLGIQGTTMERTPASQRLGPQSNELAPIERVPAAQRIEVAEPEARATTPKETTASQQKRKPERPPGKKAIQASPKLLKGSSSRRRKTTSKPTAARRPLVANSPIARQAPYPEPLAPHATSLKRQSLPRTPKTSQFAT